MLSRSPLYLLTGKYDKIQGVKQFYKFKSGGKIMAKIQTELYETEDYTIEYSCNSRTKTKQIKIKRISLKHNVEEIILPCTINNMLVTGIDIGIKASQSYKASTFRYVCKKLVLPSTLKSLSKGAFREADFFDELYVPKSISVIPEECFAFSSLKKITFEDESVITGIMERAFIHSKIKEFHCPINCDYIGDSCFMHSKLEKITGMENVVVIDIGAFAGTSNLTGVFNWPRKCTEIKDSTFDGSAISGISGIEEVVEIGRSAFAETSNLTGTFI